jgi:hypothetical protein
VREDETHYAHNITQEFAIAEEQAETVMGLSEAILAQPREHRRQLVFQALVLAERRNGGGGSTGGKRRGRPPGKRSVVAAATPGAPERKKPGPKTGIFDKLVDTLKARPGAKIVDIAKTVYGKSSAKNMHKVYGALQAMKGKRVTKVKGKGGVWRAL